MDIKLKSKVLSIYPYQDIDVSEFAIELIEDERITQRHVQNFCKSFGSKQDVNTIEAQDIVTMSCESQNPKFNKKNLVVRIGLGLYSKDLEQQLIGAHVDETLELQVKGDDVTVSIEGIVREVIPELTDELAMLSPIDGVKTKEDVITYCRFKQYDEILEEPADEAFAFLAGKVAENSVFEYDEEELKLSKQKSLTMVEDNSLLEGKSFDDVSEEEFLELFGFSKQILKEQLELTGESTLKAALLGQEQKTLTMKDYDDYLIQKAVALGCTKEEASEKTSLFDYTLMTYSDLYLDFIEAYVMKRLKELGECKTQMNQN